MKKQNIRVHRDGGNKAVSPQVPNKPESAGTAQPGHPALCEPELEEVLNRWSPEKRRRMANKFERWVRQMRFSADMQERFGGQLGEEPELVFPSLELADALRHKTRSECLAEAAKFEEWSATIRQMLGVKAQPVTSINWFGGAQ